jgi:hypothetical protein
MEAAKASIGLGGRKKKKKKKKREKRSVSLSFLMDSRYWIQSRIVFTGSVVPILLVSVVTVRTNIPHMHYKFLTRNA